MDESNKQSEVTLPLNSLQQIIYQLMNQHELTVQHTPDSPLVRVLEVLAVARARVREASGAAVLLADGILVDGGVGLRCAVVGGGDAVTGLTAIVAVPVIHSAVWVFICTDAHQKKKLHQSF